MKTLLKSFATDESGAVTVDWVVITAAVVGMGIAVLAAVQGSVTNVASDIGADLAGQLNGSNDSSYNASN